MTAKALFGVCVRVVGLVVSISGIPDLLTPMYWAGALPVVGGLVLITKADFIAGLCYPKRARDKDADFDEDRRY